jgi:hypothetical protein
MHCTTFLHKFLPQLISEETTLLDKKGVEYNEKDNVFANFEKTANELGLTREEVLLVHLNKHHDAILKMVRAIKNKDKDYFNNITESPMGRFHDVRNYYALLAAMIDEFINRR